MDRISLGELQIHGDDVLDRVEAGERLTVTRNGKAVAELVPVARSALSRAELLVRARSLPSVDPAELRADIHALLDTRLFTDGE